MSIMKYMLFFVLNLALAGGAAAGPGAHGPNGEHLDGEASTAPAGDVPRMETFTEAFELAAQLSGGELSVMVDRYETNEPVLNGKLEVEYKGVKALAKFHADMGDYAIDDARFIKAVSAPGKHPLLFTFSAGDESDLLEGTLEVKAGALHDNDNDHDHDHERTRTAVWKWAAALGLAAIAAAGLMLFIRRRKVLP